MTEAAAPVPVSVYVANYARSTTAAPVTIEAVPVTTVTYTTAAPVTTAAPATTVTYTTAATYTRAAPVTTAAPATTAASYTTAAPETTAAPAAYTADAIAAEAEAAAEESAQAKRWANLYHQYGPSARVAVPKARQAVPIRQGRYRHARNGASSRSLELAAPQIVYGKWKPMH